MTTYRNSAYAATIGLTSLLGGCTSQKGYELKPEVFRNDHYIQQDARPYVVFPSPSFLTNPDLSEGLASVAIDVDNRVPRAEIDRNTPMQYDIVITRNRKEYPLMSTKEMNWRKSENQGKPSWHVRNIAKYGGPYARTVEAHVPIETIVRMLTDEDFNKRMLQVWNPAAIDFHIMTPEEASYMTHRDLPESLVEQLTNKK